LLAYFSNVEAANTHKFLGYCKGARTGFRILKGTRVSGNRGIKIFCNVMIEREALALDQVENDFSRGRRAYIDYHQIAVAGIAKVMIDVDPDFCGTNRSERSSEPILNCRSAR
jgi:hypothetical protein